MLAFALLTTLVGVVLSEGFDPEEVVPHEEIKIRLYHDDKDPDAYVDHTLGEASTLLTHERYNTTLPVVMVIHGYDQDQDSLIQQTVHALYERKLSEWYNILAVDLPEQFSFSIKNLYYLRPALNVPLAGEALGEFLNDAIDKRFVTPNMINIISFSLGAQIAGYVGRSVRAGFGPIHSISGIEPAGIGFDLSTLVTKLIHVSKDDARYVHLYHSNSELMGSSLRLGTADYEFNGGYTQPGCKPILEPLCNHLRGFLYFHEALRLEEGLPAVQCNSLTHLVHCKCQGNRLSFIGFPLDTAAFGTYSLRTLAYPPYRMLGKRGVRGYNCDKNGAATYLRRANRRNFLFNLV